MATVTTAPGANKTATQSKRQQVESAMIAELCMKAGTGAVICIPFLDEAGKEIGLTKPTKRLGHSQIHVVSLDVRSSTFGGGDYASANHAWITRPDFMLQAAGLKKGMEIGGRIFRVDFTPTTAQEWNESHPGDSVTLTPYDYKYANAQDRIACKGGTPAATPGIVTPDGEPVYQKHQWNKDPEFPDTFIAGIRTVVANALDNAGAKAQKGQGTKSIF